MRTVKIFRKYHSVEFDQMRASFARTPRFWTGRMTKTGSANKRIPNAFWKDAPNATDEKRIEFRKKNWIYLALCLPEQLFLFMIWALIRWANFSVKLGIYWKKWTISSLSAAFGIELGLIPDLNELHLRHITHNAHCTRTVQTVLWFKIRYDKAVF